MTWEPEVNELKYRKSLAQQMGGERGIAEQKRRGKLTARERIDEFCDVNSFREFAGLTGTATYDNATLSSFIPKGSVEGFCSINGRRVIVNAGDFTVRGGSGGSSSTGLGAEPRATERALESRLPYIRLLDAAGGSVRGFETLGRTYVPDGNTFTQFDVKLLQVVPVVSAVLGSVAGLPAVNACIAHFNIMVKEISQLFPGGPPVVKAALGYDITKEDLGGEQIHVYQSGVVDNLAESEEDAFEQIRQFLSYLPQNVWDIPERTEPHDDPNRCDEELLSIVPRDTRRPYDAHKVIDHVVDTDSFFEIAPHYAKSRITGLARIDGYPVGVMANNTAVMGGTTDVAAGDKVIRFIQLCDTFHLPIISFADEPGFMVGLESEKKGIERAGARLVIATCESRTPWLTIVMGQLYGVAGQCQQRPSGLFRRYVWPSARWGSMHIEGGVSAAYRREIEESDNPEEKLAEIEARLQAMASPFRTAENTGQDVIDPRDTRPVIVEFVHDAQNILKTQTGPNPVPYRP
ncbi:MAG: acyl-CoA carboxylase subunit beta [Dehalococcoidia bacterium]